MAVRNPDRVVLAFCERLHSLVLASCCIAFDVCQLNL
eukprot:COSAG06_NODE_53209_length_301_cov_0.920792_2_plen_36_part_01